MINLPPILRDNSLPSCLPSIPSKFSTPMIFYKLGGYFWEKDFQLLQNFGWRGCYIILNYLTTVPCSCKNSPFRHPYHCHVITRKLGIVENNDLRKLFIKVQSTVSLKRLIFLKLNHAYYS